MGKICNWEKQEGNSITKTQQSPFETDYSKSFVDSLYPIVTCQRGRFVKLFFTEARRQSECARDCFSLLQPERHVVSPLPTQTLLLSQELFVCYRKDPIKRAIAKSNMRVMSFRENNEKLL
ncbi:hypothetical protein Y032_0067g129 [Ancylostoma ceylanicum]|uniref:Uncharacterized protein n=1 Tax=Ancylostoma ceylanicum TaxID=53326 RepID=A0A016U0I9_9BILA|nr:hypothetical protein Y032_0067g129 [Ancylostoma ceylanicum]